MAVSFLIYYASISKSGEYVLQVEGGGENGSTTGGEFNPFQQRRVDSFRSTPGVPMTLCTWKTTSIATSACSTPAVRQQFLHCGRDLTNSGCGPLNFLHASSVEPYFLQFCIHYQQWILTLVEAVHGRFNSCAHFFITKRCRYVYIHILHNHHNREKVKCCRQFLTL